MSSNLTIEKLCAEAKLFCTIESNIENRELYGITDGKAVGTYVEHKFQQQLKSKYAVTIGSSANGIDLPDDNILTDIKVTSIKQPQSSCPYKSAMQKIFGLGYNLLIFVYNKVDNPKTETTTLHFVSCAFVSSERTADYTITYRLREMINDQANEEDIVAYLTDRNIPADEITLHNMAKMILQNPPKQGYLTVSNALQWRLQYQRIVSLEKSVSGINKIIDEVNEK